MGTPHIIYDSQIFDAQTIGGISRYFFEIIPRMHISYDIGVCFTDNAYLKSQRINGHQIPLPQYFLQKYKNKINNFNRKYSVHLLEKEKDYLLHATYYDPYFLHHIGNHPFVITVHDMTYERLPECFNPEEAKKIFQQKKEIIENAKRIIAISQNTKKDLIEIMGVNPQKIDVIYHGTSMMPQQAYPSISLPEKYVLFVGSRYKYKNFVRFVQSFAQIVRKNPELYLICTGAPFDTSELQLIESLNLSQRALSFYANDAELATLYHQAQAFIFPSLYEGFGIPILEAYACQCPVILSNASCFPEIAGDAAAFFDPTDEKDMTSSIEEVLNNPVLRNELIEKGQKRLQLYSWDKAARQTEICYQKALRGGVNKLYKNIQRLLFRFLQKALK